MQLMRTFLETYLEEDLVPANRRGAGIQGRELPLRARHAADLRVVGHGLSLSDRRRTSRSLRRRRLGFDLGV